MSEVRTALEQLMAGALSMQEARARIAAAVTREPQIAGAVLAVLESYRAAGRLSPQMAADLQQAVRQSVAAPPPSTTADESTRMTNNVPGAATPDTPPAIPPPIPSAPPPVATPAPIPAAPPPVPVAPPRASSIAAPSIAAPSSRTGSGSGIPLGPGRVLKDRFVLESLVAGGDKGGMGVVFKARDLIKEEAQDRNPFVAIKLLNEDFKQHPDSMVALQREARRAQTLAHPNIITVYDFDRDGDIFFMAMELLNGSPLDQVIRANRDKGGLPVAEALGIITQLARALSHAHANNIVHSDFKPGNAFLTKDGVVKVLDFGIARAVKQPDGEKTRFDAGSLGAMTLPYASCEQFERQDPDPSDDVYALAIVSYELLSGRHPFERPDPNDPTKLIRTDAIAARNAKMKPAPAPIAGLSRQQWRTLQRGLAFKRTDRLRTAGEFLEGMTPPRRPVKTLIVAGVATAALLVTGGMQISAYLHRSRLEALTQRLQSRDPAAVTTALHELQQYPPDERAPVLLNDAVEDRLLNYYTERAHEQFDPESGHYDYDAAKATLKEAQSLTRAYEDSRQLNDATDRLETTRKAAIARAADTFESELSQGVLIASQGPQNVRSTLAQIRQLDPQHPLLSDRRLPIAYANQVRANLDANHLGVASALLSAGLQFAPKDAELLDLQDRIGRQQSATQAPVQAAQPTQARSSEQLHAQIEQDLASTASNDDWIAPLQRDLQSLAALSAADPTIASARTRAAQALLASSKQMVQSQRFSEAQRYLDLSRQFDLPADSYQSQADAIAQAHAQRDADDRARQSSAELTAAKQRVLDQALADHIDVAQAQFAELQRRLPGSDPFVTDAAPQAIAEAYLVRARRSANQAHFDEAYSQAQSAQAAAPNMPQFGAALQRFQSARELARQLNTLDDFSSLRPQLEQLREAERADGYHALQAGLTRVVADRLARLDAQDPARSRRLRASAEPMFPYLTRDARSASASAGSAAPASNPATIPAAPAEAPPVANNAAPPASEVAAPGTPTSAKQRSGATVARNPSTSGPAPAVSSPAPASAPCSAVSAASAAGTACRDDLGKAGRGPEMMVIPSSFGSSAFTMMRNETSVADYNAYCASAGCSQASGDSPNLPVVSVSEEDAEKYAAWLSSTTGARYRLPTESEWKHAAGTVRDNEVNCVAAGRSGGTTLRPASVGMPNEFGLRDVTGNAQEWAKPAGGGLKALGGAIGDPAEICQTAFSRPHSGRPDGRTGFRLLREIR